MKEFEGKIVVVTGGSKGIGGAAVQSFCEAGAHTIIISRNGQEGEAYAKSLREKGYKASALAADVSKVADIKKMTREIIDKYSKIDVLVNAAGVLRRKMALEQTEEDWDYVIDINLKGAYFCCTEIGRHMIAAGSGAIVNVSSIQSHNVLMERSVYAASKGGLRLFTQGLAHEWGTKGVRVNSVSPGFVGTEMVLKIMNPELDAFVKSRTPLGRIATPAEVGDTIVYLASPRASYITGTDVSIDGGWTGM